MKVIIIFLLISSINCIGIGQSIKNSTISYSGSNFNEPLFKGGFTLGEVGVQTVSSGGSTIIEGFQYINLLNGYPYCLKVRNANNDGPGSLRNAIDCSFENDEITFSSNMNGATILLNSPPVFIDKNLTIANYNVLPITLSSIESQNFSNIYISSNVIFDNVKIESLGSSFSIEILYGSYIIWR